jgi:hypothetical protein
MRLQDRIVAVLLRIYPAAWRREYGAELLYDRLSCAVVAGHTGRTVVPSSRGLALGPDRRSYRPRDRQSPLHPATP